MNKKTWMAGIDGNLTLKQICIPGSHDAGMVYTKAMRTAAAENNRLKKAFELVCTQGLDMKEQLENGVRYFDARPIVYSGADALIKTFKSAVLGPISDAELAVVKASVELLISTGSVQIGDFVTHHGGVALGMSIAQIVKASNDFVKANPSEVVLINFSHFEEFHGVDDKFIQEVCTYSDASCRLDIPYGTKICDLPLSQIKGKVIILLDNKDMYEKSVKAKEIKGIYQLAHNGEFALYDDNAQETNYKLMVTNQMCKFGRFNEDKLFLLNWTMPARGRGGIPSKLGIERYATKINVALLNDGHASDFLLRPNFYGKMVNIINGDFWEKAGDDVVKACLKVMENRGHKQDAVKLISMNKTFLHLDPITRRDGEGGCIWDGNHVLYRTWYKKHVRDNVFRLQNVGSGLYLTAARSSILSSREFPLSNYPPRDNHLVAALGDSSDRDQEWHMEEIWDRTYHVVARKRKSEGISENRLDGHIDNLYLNEPNDNWRRNLQYYEINGINQQWNELHATSI